jgi:hypothetical protein
MPENCLIPNPENFKKTEDEISQIITDENVFTGNQTNQLTDLLMKQIKFSGGGCNNDEQEQAARFYLISLSGLITFIIQQVISRIRDLKKSDNELINESALTETVKIKSSLTKVKAEVYSYLFSTTDGIQQLDPADKAFFNFIKDKTNAVDAKIKILVNSTLNILKSVGSFCAYLTFSLISSRGLDFNMENVKAMANEIIDNVYNNFNSLISLSASNISEGFINYVEGKESTLSTILVPLENWICNWLYNVRGGRKLKPGSKKRKRVITKRRTRNNKKKNKFFMQR